MIISIPFSGFYDSIHSDNVEHELYNGVFTDHDRGCTNNDRLSELVSDSINWRDLYFDYAKEYVKAFNDKFSLNLVFDELSSPREYNFTTDRIFCRIELDHVLTIRTQTDYVILQSHANDMFKSRSGFISFYDPNIYAWDLISEWDCNQLDCLLRAWIESYHDITDWNETELYLMDDFISCNGGAYELIYKHCADKRLFSVSDYLNKRAKRV